MPLRRGFDEYPEGARKIIVAAERLFGERGFEGVSVRQIILAASQANNSAVKHYFGNKDGLIQAVFERRLPELEKARWQRLVAAAGAGHVGYRELLDALLFPVVQAFDDENRSSYLLFSWRVLHSDRADLLFARARDKVPATVEIVERLRACFPDLPDNIFSLRFRIALDVFVGGMAEWQSKKRNRNPYSSMEQFWNDAMEMVTSVICVPFAPPHAPPSGETKQRSAPGKSLKDTLRRHSEDSVTE